MPSPAHLPMRLLILGASGGCGAWLTRIAVARGHHVTAVVREGSSIDAFSVAQQCVRGDVLEPSVLDRALATQDAVLCSLGIRRAGKSPWAPILSPANFMESVMQRLIPAMNRAGVTRIIAISAAGVGESEAQLTLAVRHLLDLGNVAVAYRDLAVMERQLGASALDWMAVRPVTLVHGDVRGTAREINRFSLMSTIRRADVAQWMIERIEQNRAFVPHTVTLGS